MNITGHRIPHRLVVVIVFGATLYLLPLGFDGAAAAASGLSECRAVIDAPTSASGGSAVAIVDRSIAPKGAALTSRAWFFGDGSSQSGASAGATVDHTYPVPASRMTKKYSIRLLLSFSNGAQCSAVAPILIINSAPQKGFTKLDLRGSMLTNSVVAPLPNCGLLNATMHWIPRFGIEDPSDFAEPVLRLFGTAEITSNGVTQRDPESITVFLSSQRIVGVVLKYASVATNNKIWTSLSCTQFAQRLGAEFATLISHSPVGIRSGSSKLKCTPATATEKASCKIEPSKTLYITGAWDIAHITTKVDLHVHFSKETCTYLGPTQSSPLATLRVRWYKCH